MLSRSRLIMARPRRTLDRARAGHRGHPHGWEYLLGYSAPVATAALVERAQTAQKLTVEMNRGFDDSGKARRRAPHLTANGVHIAMAFSQNRRKHGSIIKDFAVSAQSRPAAPPSDVCSASK